MDYYLPVSSYDNKIIFSGSKVGNELWVSLLEKAFAKTHGSYETVEGGLGLEVFVALTGAPSKMYDLNMIED